MLISLGCSKSCINVLKAELLLLISFDAKTNLVLHLEFGGSANQVTKRVQVLNDG